MGLADDFAKVQLAAAAATKDIVQGPRLGAPHAPNPLPRCLIPPATHHERASPASRDTPSPTTRPISDRNLPHLIHRVPHRDGSQRTPRHPGQGQGERASPQIHPATLRCTHEIRIEPKVTIIHPSAHHKPFPISQSPPVRTIRRDCQHQARRRQHAPRAGAGSRRRTSRRASL